MSRRATVKKQNCCLTLDEDIVSSIDSMKGRMSRSAYITLVLEKHIKKNNRE